MDRPIMFAEKSWGSYRILDVGEQSLTVKVVLNAGQRMQYHSHQRRDEVWTIISGTGEVIVDGNRTSVGCGDVILLKAGVRHTILAETELQVIEVQSGKDISVRDKTKHPFP
jgi:mannose-1-phosphate guanylyltransferase